MKEEWWETPVCWLCNYWWILLLILVLALTAWFSRNLWMPYIIPSSNVPVTSEVSFIPTTTSPVVTSMPTMVSTLGTGDVQITLQWAGYNDLDLYVEDPTGVLIYYGNPVSSSGGILDVDSNRACDSNITNQPRENVYWPVGDAPSGNYRIYIRYYKQCNSEPLPVEYTVRVLVDGQEQEFQGSVQNTGQEVPVAIISK